MERITDRDIAEKIAELFKGFCDPTRVQILSLLAEREMCVTDIAEATQVTQSACKWEWNIFWREFFDSPGFLPGDFFFPETVFCHSFRSRAL